MISMGGIPNSKLEFPAQLSSKGHVRFQQGQHAIMPEWAVALIRLGWWCRNRQIPGKRILAVGLLPTRMLAGTLVAFGGVIGGAQQSKPGLTWDRLRTLPVGTELHWRWPNESKPAKGVVQEPDEATAHLVRVHLTAGPKKGMVWSFSEATFFSVAFSQEKLPSDSHLVADEEAKAFLKGIEVCTDPRWFASGSPEVTLVANSAEFVRSLTNLQVVADSKSAMVSSVLSASVFRAGRSCKVQVVPVNGDVERDAPLRILDGAHAFRRLRDDGSSSSNVVALLDRGEFSSEIEDQMKRIQRTLGDLSEELRSEVSDVLQRLDLTIHLADAET